MRVMGLVVWVAMVGCAGSNSQNGSGGGRIDSSQFPSAGEVAAIASRPLPAPLEGHDDLTESWQFQSLPATTFGDVPVPTLTELEAGMGVTSSRFSVASRCVALETSHFFATKGRFPDRRLAQALRAHCGSADSNGAVYSSSFADVGNMKPADIRTELAKAVRDQIAAYAGDVGVAVSQVGKRAVIVIVEQTPEVWLEPSSRMPEPTSPTGIRRPIEVRGRLQAGREKADVVHAVVNQGAIGSAVCARDEAVALPAFHFTCSVDPTDATAGLSLYAKQPGRFLMDNVAEAMVLPGNTTTKEWRPKVYGDPTPLPPTQEDIARRLVERINRVRAQRGSEPLLLAAEQSATATQLAPHWVEAANQGNTAELDQIAMGLAAGWDLKVPVVDVDFGSGYLGGKSIDVLMGELLDSPFTRQSLLSPPAGIIAMGLHQQGQAVSALISTWERFVERPAAEVQARTFEALKKARASRGFPVLGEVPVEAAVQRASEQLTAGESPESVLNALLRTTVNTMQYPFRGWYLETTDETTIAWPSELLTSSPTFVTVAAGTHPRRSGPWATTAVVIVAYVAPTTVAMAP